MTEVSIQMQSMLKLSLKGWLRTITHCGKHDPKTHTTTHTHTHTHTHHFPHKTNDMLLHQLPPNTSTALIWQIMVVAMPHHPTSLIQLTHTTTSTSAVLAGMRPVQLKEPMDQEMVTGLYLSERLTHLTCPKECEESVCYPLTADCSIDVYV